MNKLISLLFILLCLGGTALAEGGKNQGTTGTGELTTGADAQGSAAQDRTGR